jgi:hypothetical protein
MTVEAITEVLAGVFDPQSWPPPLRRRTGDMRHLRSLLRKAIAAEKDAPKYAMTVRILGSLVLGEAAERVFESLYRTKLSTTGHLEQ